MPKIQLFKIKAKVDSNKKLTLDHLHREVIQENLEEFDEKHIAKKAQEIGEFNRIEQDSIREMGEGSYTIEYKHII